MQDILFVSLCSAAVLFAAPAVAARFARGLGLPSILLFGIFVVFQQLFFAAASAIAGSYFLSFPIAALLVTFSGLAAMCWGEKAETASSGGVPDSRLTRLLPWVLFGVLFAGYAAIRANYSYINFNNNGDEAGVEKLFNLSLQQSFLFGRGYPPEWVWLSGEPIRYYVFLKSIPGLASWIARVLFGNAETGGVFFILSEALFGALPYGMLCGWVLWFGREAKSQSAVRVLAAVLAILCFAGTHYQAVSLGVHALLRHATVDWWQLSREVVPFTDNQYPVWLLILGDNHAYMQVYFLQILFWGSFLRLMLLEKFSGGQAGVCGALAVALVLSHPGSVLVDLTILPVFLIMTGISCLRRNQWGRIRLAGLHGAIGGAVAAAFLILLYSPVGKVNVTFPPRALASSAVDFLNLNFSVLVCMVLLASIPAVFGVATGALRRNLTSFPVLILSAALLVVFGLCHLPALCLMTLIGFLAYLILFDEKMGDSERILALFAVASFSVWLPPEVVAFDHAIDNRTDWIRFQMGLRFWPEGYLLIPFALAVAVIRRAGERSLPRGWVACACGVLLLMLASHIPGIANRISRSQQNAAELDGFAEFSRRFAADARIVSHLRSLPAESRVVIAESCGLGDPRIPHHFAWPGRIAAFSGRAGVCGWARHAVLYNNPLQQTGFRGVSVEERTAMFLQAYAGLLRRFSAGQLDQAALDLMTLRALGVTHIVYGEFERALFPGFSLEAAARTLPVMLEFSAPDGMGVLRINE